MICVCGACCDGCPKHKSGCAGCEVIGGKVYWANYIGFDVCHVFKCARDRLFKNCGDCSEIPCRLWFSLRDPAMTEEEHEKSVKERVAAFKRTKL
jgi:hypothetical protein